MKKAFFYSIVCCSLLAGCSMMRVNPPTQISTSAKAYLKQSAQTSGSDSQQYQLMAVNQMLADNNLNDANQLLNTLGSIPLDPTTASERYILKARLALQRDKPKEALTYLQKVRALKNLSYNAQAVYYTISINAHLRMHDVAYSTMARISLSALLKDETAVLQNRQVIWQNVQTLPTGQLNTLLKRTSAPLIRGWLQLALVESTYANQPKKLVAAIQDWQRKYVTHPANQLLPDTDRLQTILQAPTPTHIVLLLPLHGSLGQMGQAVRDGFITAFYANKKKAQRPNVQVVDTSQDVPIEDLYQDAINQGADFVVGPLTKQNVERLADNGNVTVPTLVLNYLPDDQTVPPNMVEFGLAPEQSAEQAAGYAWEMGVNDVLIITPQGDRADKVKQAFMQQWQALGGDIVGVLTFSTKDKLADDIRAVLNIDDSQKRADALRKILKQKFKVQARRRQDINGIFLLATPAQSQQINPLLRFYYAGDLPIFSIADIYNGYPNARRDIDLDGIYFVDMPLLLARGGSAAALRRTVQSTWRDNYRRNNRLYGLGMDAYMLSTVWTRLWALPNFAINGVTGQLYLNSNHHIYRQLLQARFVKGLAVVGV